MSNIKLNIIPNARTVTAAIKESESYFLCPANTVMTGRYHTGDENGQTRYEYATLKAVDENGIPVSGTITVEDVKWATSLKESSGNGYDAPANRVIVGRQHHGDENGQTQYATAIIKFNGDATYVENPLSSSAIKESSGIWFKTNSERVLIGRHHSGDENGNTFYYSGSVTTQFNPEEKIRVIVALHPDEKYYPMEPLDFIKKSRFRKHVSGGSDDGYSKVKHAFVNGDSHAPEYYDIPVAVINTFYVGDFQKNLRPRDDNSLGSGEVFLQPDDHTVGDNNPTGRVPVFTHSSTYVKDGQTRERRELWMFYGYNSVESGVLRGEHQGDWERVTLDIYNYKIVGAWLDQHGNSNYYTANQLEITESNGVQTLKIYSAIGSHATYEGVGSFNKQLIADDHTGNGYQWEITQKTAKLNDQPWIYYAGAWGEVGITKHSTGPLGPWYKRMDFNIIM